MSRDQYGKIDWEEMLEKVTDPAFQQECRQKSPTNQGHMIHALLEKEYDTRDDLNFEEDVLDDDGEVVGQYDCRDIETGYVYEFKTRDDLGMAVAPQGEDVDQLTKYLEELPTHTGFLVYINREGFETERYPVHHNETTTSK